MTAKTFYGASWQTLDRARRQVLQTVRECSCTVKYHKKIMSN